MNSSPIQVRFNEKKSIDVSMCKRYENAGNRAGTLRDDVHVGHALAQANSVLYQMILAMAKANKTGAICVGDLKKIIELADDSTSSRNEATDKLEEKNTPDIGGMGGLSV